MRTPEEEAEHLVRKHLDAAISAGTELPGVILDKYRRAKVAALVTAKELASHNTKTSEYWQLVVAATERM